MDYGIDGLFRNGIRALLETKLLVGSVNNFDLTRDYSAEVHTFLQINRPTLDKMISVLRGTFREQFYRNDLGEEIIDVMKGLKFSLKDSRGPSE